MPFTQVATGRGRSVASQKGDVELHNWLTSAVEAYESQTDRSMQRALGPSEIGDPCVRKLAHKLAGTRVHNPDGDPWKRFMGTAGHARLADVYEWDARRSHTPAWLAERRVTVGDSGLSGTADLFADGTVIDHKIVGSGPQRKYRTLGPGDQYRKQVHLYGRGFERDGHEVRRVAIAFWLRDGALRDLYVWSEPYDRAVADAALHRVDQITEMVRVGAFDVHPERFALLPSAPGWLCKWCPFYSPRSTDPTACPGDLLAGDTGT